MFDDPLVERRLLCISLAACALAQMDSLASLLDLHSAFHDLCAVLQCEGQSDPAVDPKFVYGIF